MNMFTSDHSGHWHYSKSLWLLPLLVLLIVVVAAIAWPHAQSSGTAGQFGRIAVDPPYVVVNKATPVVFTAKITDPQLKKRSVILLRVDSTGKSTDILGRLRDDGTNGDATANDNIYSIRTTLTEPTVGLSAFRVAARFKPGRWTEPEPDDDDWDKELAAIGQSGRDRPVIRALILALLNRLISKRYTLSDPIQVTVDPFKLPPDPGEAGKQTLQGIDSDRDGVRDDVQRYIAIRFVASASTTAALRQLARANQDIIANSSGSRATVEAIDSQRSKSIFCLNHVRREVLHDDVAAAHDVYNLMNDLKAVLLNTRERSKAFFRADQLLGGTSGSIPDSMLWASFCM